MSSIFQTIASQTAPPPTQAAVFGDILEVVKTEAVRKPVVDAAMREANNIHKRAGEEAFQIIEDARLEAQNLRDEARQLGYREGFNEGYAAGSETARAEGEKRQADLRQDMQLFVEHLLVERERLWKQVEPQAVALALEVAQKVVKDDAVVNPDIVLSITRNALRRISDSSRLRLRVNLQDLESVRSNRAALMTIVEGIEQLELIEDRRVGQGGCILESTEGAIDARLDSQLADIQKAFQTLLEEAA